MKMASPKSLPFSPVVCGHWTPSVFRHLNSALTLENQKSGKKEIIDMTYEEKLKSLENIFKKPLSKQSGFKSVFKDLYFKRASF